MAKPFLQLDANVYNSDQYENALKADIEYNRIVFTVPDGFAVIPLIEECRALEDIDNFDLMYDITMQMLVGKSVYIQIRNYKNDLLPLGDPFVVTDRYMDLRSVSILDQYPVLVVWLVKFVSGYLKKKFPLQYISKEAENKKEEKKTQTKKSKKA